MIGTKRLCFSVGCAYLVCGHVVVPFGLDEINPRFLRIKNKCMKKLFLISLAVLVTLNAWAFHPLKSTKLEDPNLTKEACWEIVKLWVVSDMDDRDAYIAYQNYESGKMLIKGEYVDGDNRMQSVQNKFVRPYIGYEIEVNCEDGCFEAKFTKATYRFKSWAGNPYSLDDFTLKRCYSEMEEIKDVMYIKGEVWDAGDYFSKRRDELEKLSDEAEAKMGDETLKKKQRAMYREQYFEYSSKSSVHHAVNHSIHNLVMSLHKLYKNVKNTIE